MPPTDRTLDRGRRRGRYLIVELGRELREARIAAGLSQADVARAAATTGSVVGKIERGETPGVSLQRLAELFAVVGCELAARAYQDGDAIRDKGQVAAFARARPRFGPLWRWLFEAVLRIAGDRRAWDALIRAGSTEVPIEVETRLRDIQATLRRIDGKLRDDGRLLVLLLVADTRANRAAVHAAGQILADAFPVPATEAWAALRAGRAPRASALLFV